MKSIPNIPTHIEVYQAYMYGYIYMYRACDISCQVILKHSVLLHVYDSFIISDMFYY